MPDGGECCPGYITLYDAYWHLVRGAPAQCALDPVWWRWRFQTEGRWSKWIALNVDEVSAFRDLQGHHLESGHCELQPLYALTSTERCAPTASELLDQLLVRIDFDGMDPNTFTIAELRRAI